MNRFPFSFAFFAALFLAGCFAGCAGQSQTHTVQKNEVVTKITVISSEIAIAPQKNCTYFENGQQEQCSTQNKETGEVIHRVQFYESGVTKSEMKFQDGSLRETSYYESGAIQRTVRGDTVEGFYESGALQFRFLNEVSYHSFYEDGTPKTEEFAINEKFRTMKHFQKDGRHDYDAILGNIQGPQFKRIYGENGGVQEEYSCYHQRHFYPSGNLKFQVDYTDTTAVYTLFSDKSFDPQNPDANVMEKITKKAGENDANLGKAADETGAPKIKPFVPEQYRETCRELEKLLAENPAAQKFLDQ